MSQQRNRIKVTLGASFYDVTTNLHYSTLYVSYRWACVPSSLRLKIQRRELT
ncbi:hypothetical protein WN55_06945 [Dufourea novaeangliae]|uniref:Uncharacterized protein n=1 Tax=Dufourea novaeangliae TaxID=178035 RepID=A0A154PT28_DUFNO|nr:hypothetical protein WN55_06945 [Dufourea novaeangliae]